MNGDCVDMPSEPAESNFKDKVRITAYPCEERGGVVWAYMGPPELKPELPNLAWAACPDENRYLSKCLQDCNWLQALEGGIDSSHISFLHSSLKPADYALNVSSRGLQTPPCTTARRASSSSRPSTGSSSARAGPPRTDAITGASPRGCSPTPPSSRPRPMP